MSSDWMAEGIRIFGPLNEVSMLRWKFTCPMCGHIQDGESFRQFKHLGAAPPDAFRVCAGHFSKLLGCGYNSREGDMFCPLFVRFDEKLAYGVFDFYRGGASLWKPIPIRN